MMHISLCWERLKRCAARRGFNIEEMAAPDMKDYHPLAGSHCIGVGVNLRSLNLPGLNADKDGNPRPASGLWDLGGYQY